MCMVKVAGEFLRSVNHQHLGRVCSSLIPSLSFYLGKAASWPGTVENGRVLGESAVGVPWAGAFQVIRRFSKASPGQEELKKSLGSPGFLGSESLALLWPEPRAQPS